MRALLHPRRVRLLLAVAFAWTLVAVTHLSRQVVVVVVPTPDNQVVEQLSCSLHNATASRSDVCRMREQAQQAPILATVPSRQHPIHVRVLAFQHIGRQIVFRSSPYRLLGDEMLNIVVDGLNRSLYWNVSYTEVPDYHVAPDFVMQEATDSVWLVDLRPMLNVAKHGYSLHQQLLTAVNATIGYQRQRVDQDPTSTPPRLQVVIMDWRDEPKPAQHCNDIVALLSHLLGPGHLRLAVRAVVNGRHWQTNFVEPGQFTVLDDSGRRRCYSSQPILPLSYTVRSEHVIGIEEEYQQYLPTDRAGLPPDTVRPMHVAHFWGGHRGSNPRFSRLRTTVTELVADLGRTANYTVQAGAVSEGGPQGRTGLSLEYLRALLQSKIVVVAQRDNWEDHYRLFEAMVGGALVLTDPMLTLPEYLVDRVHLVIYHSLDELKELICYYLEHDTERLAIAHQGYQVALRHHRTFHLMERLFFGRQLTV